MAPKAMVPANASMRARPMVVLVVEAVVTAPSLLK